MDEQKKRPDWRNFPFEDEEAAIRHINENSVSPEAREKAMKVYLHMKRNYDEVLLEELAADAQMASSNLNPMPQAQAV